MDIEELKEEAKRVIRVEIDSMNETMKAVDEKFSLAVKMICSSQRLVISGVGKSGMIAKKIAATFSSIGISAFFMHPVDALHGDLGMVQDGDTAILLSKSGSTEDIVRLIPYLKGRGAGIISIVSDLESVLSRQSDINLYAKITEEACPFNLAPTSSTVAALAIGDALAIASMKYNKFTLEDFSRLHPLGQIGRNITLHVADIMHTGENLPILKKGGLFRDAIIEITNKKLGCVCINDDRGNLTGIITDGDVRRALQKYPEINGLRVEDVMTQNPVCVQPDAFLSEALAVMEQRQSQINVLPVKDENGIVTGIIRLHDIIRSGL